MFSDAYHEYYSFLMSETSSCYLRPINPKVVSQRTIPCATSRRIQQSCVIWPMRCWIGNSSCWVSTIGCALRLENKKIELVVIDGAYVIIWPSSPSSRRLTFNVWSWLARLGPTGLGFFMPPGTLVCRKLKSMNIRPFGFSNFWSSPTGKDLTLEHFWTPYVIQSQFF